MSSDSEPMLQEEPGRINIFPLRHPHFMDWVYKMEDVFWTRREVNMDVDILHWKDELTDSDKHTLSLVLTFLNMADELVIANLEQNVIPQIQWMEVERFYIEQMKNEATHSESYGFMLQSLLTPDEIDAANKAVKEMPVIRDMYEWGKKWMSADVSFCDRMVAFAVFEGVMFQGSFAIIQSYAERNLMPGLVRFNEFISRDEGIHKNYACFLYDELINKTSADTIQSIVREAVELLDSFYVEAAPDYAPKGISIDTVISYNKYIANVFAGELGVDSVFPDHEANPFEWMRKLYMNRSQKVNFFEHSGSEYQHGSEDVDGVLSIRPRLIVRR